MEKDIIILIEMENFKIEIILVIKIKEIGKIIMETLKTTITEDLLMKKELQKI